MAIKLIHSPDQFTKCPQCNRIYRVKPNEFYLLDCLMVCRCLFHFKAERYQRKKNEGNRGCDFSKLISEDSIREFWIRDDECPGGLFREEAKGVLLHPSVIKAVQSRMLLLNSNAISHAGSEFLDDIVELIPSIECLQDTPGEFLDVIKIDRTIIVEAIKHLRKRPFDLDSKRIADHFEQHLLHFDE